MPGTVHRAMITQTQSAWSIIRLRSTPVGSTMTKPVPTVLVGMVGLDVMCRVKVNLFNSIQFNTILQRVLNRNVMEKLMRVHDSIKPQVWPTVRRQNLSECSLYGSMGCGRRLSASEAISEAKLVPVAHTAHPPNWIQAYLATARWAKPAGLIES